MLRGVAVKVVMEGVVQNGSEEVEEWTEMHREHRNGYLELSFVLFRSLDDEVQMPEKQCRMIESGLRLALRENDCQYLKLML